MTQKKLIDYCNGTPWNHCMNGCPYDLKECAAYGLKYNGSIPIFDDFYHPERYTDEELVLEAMTNEDNPEETD